MDEKKKLFLKAYENSACNATVACKSVGIGRTALYEWKKDDSDFATEMKEIELSLIDIAESRLMKNIIEGKEVSLIFFLTNRAGERWKHKNAQVHVEQKTGVFNLNGQQVTPDVLIEQIKENYGNDTETIARRLADALEIRVPSSSPQITE